MASRLAVVCVLTVTLFLYFSTVRIYLLISVVSVSLLLHCLYLIICCYLCCLCSYCFRGPHLVISVEFTCALSLELTVLFVMLHSVCLCVRLHMLVVTPTSLSHARLSFLSAGHLPAHPANRFAPL